MPLAALPSILAVADASAISADNPLFVAAVGGVVIGGVVMLVTVVDRVDSIIQRRRRQPSVDVNLTELQSSIASLTEAVKELKEAREAHNGHREKIAALEEKCRKLEADASAFESSQRSYLAKTFREWFERLEAVQTTVAANFKDVERGLGKVEGALEQLTERINSKG